MMAISLILLYFRASSAATNTPIMPNLLFPKWPPTYNLTQSTMTQTCFGPTPVRERLIDNPSLTLNLIN